MYSQPRQAWNCSVVKNDLECLSLLPQECWDYRHVLAAKCGYVNLGMEPKVCVLGELSHVPSPGAVLSHTFLWPIWSSEKLYIITTTATNTFWNVL